MWAFLAILATGLGVGVQAYSSYQQGQAQAQRDSFNALIAQQNAELTVRKQKLAAEETAIKSTQFEKKGQSLKAAQRAQYAKAGVQMEGTPLLVQADTQRELDIDALAIKYAGSIEQSSLLAQEAEFRQAEKLYKMRSREAKQAGVLGSGDSLLTGLAQGSRYLGRKP